MNKLMNRIVAAILLAATMAMLIPFSLTVSAASPTVTDISKGITPSGNNWSNIGRANDESNSTAATFNSRNGTRSMTLDLGGKYHVTVISVYYYSNSRITDREVTFPDSTATVKSTGVSNSTYTYTVDADITKVQISVSKGNNTYGVGIYEIVIMGYPAATTTSVKYKPVTIYNYNTESAPVAGKDRNFNYDTRTIEYNANSNLTRWNGLYFSSGDPQNNFSSDRRYNTSGTAVTTYIDVYGEQNKWSGYMSGYGGGWHFGGIVKSALHTTSDATAYEPSGTPAFNYLHAGIFSSAEINKDVYTNVGMPFVYDSATGYYVYDSNAFNAHFPVVGNTLTPADNVNLVLDNPVSAGGSNGFYPFNTSASGIVYNFGLSASIDFMFPADGLDPNGNPIAFEFSGDDDVWVFIDGKLVLDIGGIHDAIGGSLNFAANTSTVNSDGSVSGTATTSQIFNTKDNAGNTTVGLLGITAEAFAAKTGNHTLQIFYLERGSGQSNCKIKFNLPEQDSVSVTKNVVLSADSDELTATQWAAINSTNFTFRLQYNTNDGSEIFGDVGSGISYFVYDQNMAFLRKGTTGANGSFTLRNGETARFVTQSGFDLNGKYFRVVETGIDQTTYEETEWTVPGLTASVLGLTSVKQLVPDSTEVTSIEFVCTNTLSNEFVTINPDIVALDYGKSTLIDVIGNDITPDSQSGTQALTLNTIIAQGANGTARIVNNKIEYTPKTFLQTVDVIRYSINTIEGLHETTLTVVPATSVYYEENIRTATVQNGSYLTLVDFSEGWTTVAGAAPTTTYQESGIVGDFANNSTYGTDTSYLNDNVNDSNGTAYKATSTAALAPSFTYTFKGTGTAIFARTENLSGIIRVNIVKLNANGTVDNTFTAINDYIDTFYAIPADSLYNVPVYDNNVVGAYGTYKVTVTVAKPDNDFKYGSTNRNEFYFDGFRVYNPIETTVAVGGDVDYATVKEVYIADKESSAETVNLRDLVLAKTEIVTVNGTGTLSWVGGYQSVSFNDKDGGKVTGDPLDYELYGPKSEIYLKNGNNVRFDLNGWFDGRDDDTRVYLGAKSPDGTPITLKINGNNLTVDSTVDCYYDITDYIEVISGTSDGKADITVVTGDAGAFAALTNIKVTESASAYLGNRQ